MFFFLFILDSIKAGSYLYKEQDSTDVDLRAIRPLDSSLVNNELECMNLCTLNFDCKLAVFQLTGLNCKLFDSRAQNKIVNVPGSVLYQKRTFQ